jgi:hypothetical protein
MIEKYVSDIAERLEIPLTHISMVNVNPIAGMPYIHLLKLSSEKLIFNTLIFQVDLERLQSGANCDLLEIKLKTVLERMKAKPEVFNRREHRDLEHDIFLARGVKR